MKFSATSNVHRHVLPNGLRVLIKQRPGVGVVTVLARVGVGYFHEIDRWNGISHVIEHMMFKGTNRRPGKEQVAQEVRALGGSINASTYYEETAYHTTLPKEYLEQAMDIQADTLLNPLIDSDELAKEIEVIIQESRQKRDNPQAMLTESSYELAFDAHRIRRWRIGHDETLRAMRRSDLLEFMQQTYRPANIVLAIVGDIDPNEALGLAEKYWSAMPSGEMHLARGPVEAARRGFRYRRMTADIQQRLFLFSAEAPHELHEDSHALSVLGAVLSDGRSARLYRALKERDNLANTVWAGYEGFADLGVFTLGADARSSDPSAAEEAILREVAKLQKDLVQPEELERVKTRMMSRLLFADEDVYGMARYLSSYEALGHYMLAGDDLNRLLSVTDEDVRRVAETYVQPDRLSLLEYVPVSDATPEPSCRTVHELVSSALNSDSQATHQMVREIGINEPVEIGLDGAATLLTRVRRDIPVVAVHVLFPGGRRNETPENCGITHLMLKSSLKGAGGLSAEEIAYRVESLGSSIGISAGGDYFGYSLRLPADRFAAGLDVLKKVIAEPEFASEEVAKEQQAALGDIRRSRDSMSSRAFELFYTACYGDGAYGLPTLGFEENVPSLTPALVRAWWNHWVTSRTAVIGIAGDIEPEQARDLLDGFLPDTGTPIIAPAPPSLSPNTKVVEAERFQTAAVMGFHGVPVGSEDRPSLDVLSEIASGLAGRFFQAVRGESALAYAVSASHRARQEAGHFVTYTATSPEKEERAREILMAECRMLATERVREEELASAKSAIRGMQLINRQGCSALAGEIALLRLYGLPLNATDLYLSAVQRLTTDDLLASAERYLRPNAIWSGIVRGRTPKPLGSE